MSANRAKADIRASGKEIGHFRPRWSGIVSSRRRNRVYKASAERSLRTRGTLALEGRGRITAIPFALARIAILADKPPSYHLYASNQKSVHHSFTKAPSPFPLFYANFSFVGNCAV